MMNQNNMNNTNCVETTGKEKKSFRDTMLQAFALCYQSMNR